MSALIPVVVCPTVLLFLFFISNKGSDLQPKYIQVSDWELLGYSLFLWLVFIVFCINSLNSSGVLGISPQSEVRLNLVAGICVLVSEPVFLFVNARIRKSRPAPLLIPYKTVWRYFPDEATQEEIETTIQRALKFYFARRGRNMFK